MRHRQISGKNGRKGKRRVHQDVTTIDDQADIGGIGVQ